MKALTIVKRGLLGLVLVPVLMFGTVNKAHAQIPYVEGVSSTSTTPVFNQYTGVPVTGDESDFVRLRVSNGTSTADAGTNPFIDPVTDTCNIGDEYDIRTYVHNGASQDSNNNGTGTAVARNTTVAITAPLNKTSKDFEFGSTISASNAASVTDKGTLHCSKDVQLKLVPHSVYSSTKDGWVLRDDSGVNGSMKIGSRVAASGDVWGCWDERVMVVYTVEVVKAPTPPPVAEFSCDLLTNTGKIADNKYGFKVTYTATNGATLKDVTYVYSDGTTTKDGATTSHLFTDTNTTKHITATANFTVTGSTEIQSKTSDKCKTDITIPTTPVVLAAATLPATGAGSVIGIFAGTSILGAFLYRLRALRTNR